MRHCGVDYVKLFWSMPLVPLDTEEEYNEAVQKHMFLMSREGLSGSACDYRKVLSLLILDYEARLIVETESPPEFPVVAFPDDDDVPDEEETTVLVPGIPDPGEDEPDIDVIGSGPMPEFLRNKSLPDLPAEPDDDTDIPPAVRARKGKKR